MDAYLAIASRREGRRYAPRPIPEALVRRVLDAGRLAGSAMNRQPCRFLIVEHPEALAKTVFEPDNVLGAALVVAVAVHGKGPVDFDAGRAAQNMLLAAWNEGLASCPNGLADRDRAHEVLGLGEDERIAVVLTFGYPETPRDPGAHTPEEWSSRANRLPLDEVVRKA